MPQEKICLHLLLQSRAAARTSVVHLGQQVLEVLHGAVERVHVPEILHVVAKVPHGGAVDGAHPHRLDVQVLEVIQFLQDSCQPTHTVSTQSSETVQR